MSATLFDDIFKVTSVDSSRYDRVSRITGQSSTSADIHLTLDVNTELFPVTKGTTLTVAVAQTISLDGEPSISSAGWREPKAGEKSLADDYDYVMYGTVYKFEESSADKM
ncbi:DNA-directed RNA polymerase core subunit RPB8 [Sugiyamaella lignohabitans]|uniref:DNA-directed RNA polymerase core subunit RPB8 n=1 Tax=Sugiyamaella lignohabitans TaxID=796027 RepID=A0A161HJW4_9ASCO|nr:DNA-directed RNA polymerase core subunit RPB8 [Sugiyamaella lignohabitans]ANB11798.1 DNA-directed RNA polymerase core subunit RPB8 [Sugiyamaella lignohabitans]